jgi:hydroxymethylglutaryl-CoA synthase
MLRKKVGIDDIEIYIPSLYVDNLKLARVRNQPEEKIKKGIGVIKSSLPDVNEDPASMGATACIRLLQRKGISPKEIAEIRVATESSLDESKPLNTYIIGMLEKVYGKGSFEHCIGPEEKFACASSSYAVMDAVHATIAQRDEKYRIVIATDIAKYDLNSSAEFTQGAGAVAILIKEDPNLLAINHKSFVGRVIDAYDFFRPPEKETPIVNGPLSIAFYLVAMSKCYDALKRKISYPKIVSKLIRAIRKILRYSKKETLFDNIDEFAMHTPFPGMVRKFSAYLMRHELKSKGEWKKIKEEIEVPEPPINNIEELLYNEDLYRRDIEFMRAFMKTELFKNIFNEKFEKALVLSREIGNTYAASTYFALLSCLLHTNKPKNIYIGSYGSGCTAVGYLAKVQGNYKNIINEWHTVSRMLNQRKEIDIETYEELHKGKIKEPLAPNISNRFVLEKNENGIRTYKFV